MPITVGQLDNVPAPGDPIRSPWAQEISGYVVHPFATKAALDAAWGTAPNGSLAVTLDTGYRWYRTASSWIYAGGGSPPLYYASVVRVAALTLAANAFTQIPYDTEESDPNNNFSGGLYTAPINGTYQFHAVGTAALNNPNQRFMIGFYIGGVEAVRGNDMVVNIVGSYGLVVSGVVTMAAGATAGIRIGVFVATTNVCNLDVTTAPLNRFSIYRIS